MTPAPELEPFAAELHNALEPLAVEDEANGYALAHFIGAVGAMFQAVDTLARDQGARPGWAAVVDADAAPAEWLPWLAQFVGATIAPGATEAEARALIRDVGGFKRGTPAAIRAAAAATLTGEKRVTLRERDGSPYRLEVVTPTSETPDPAATEAAIRAHKPAGILLEFRHVSGQDYQAISGATYTTTATNYPTYSRLLSGEV